MLAWSAIELNQYSTRNPAEFDDAITDDRQTDALTKPGDQDPDTPWA